MHQVVALIGPTAVGKTDVSIELAKRLDAEIVGCDSMQVYRHMPVLTQQPTSSQRAAIPHHLIDCVEPTEPFSVGHYRRAALDAIAAIQRRGNAVLLVGGTGLYLKALTDGLCEAPPADATLRRELVDTAQACGSATLYERLKAVDPVAATNIHPHDTRRLVRALEVYELTGEPLSRFWQRTDAPVLPMTLIGLNRNRAELYERINRRVERMIREDGALEEATRVSGLPLSHTARQVHGLKFLEAYLKEERTLADTIRLWQQQVRNYARRQLTWFRAEPRIRWITIESDDTVEAVVDQILKQLESGQVAEWLSGQAPSHFVTLPPSH